MGLLTYLIPWQVKLAFWVIVALVITVLVMKLFGFKWGAIFGAATGVLIAAATIYNKGQQAGYSDLARKQASAQKAATDDFQELHNADLALPDADLDRANSRWLQLEPAHKSQ